MSFFADDIAQIQAVYQTLFGGRREWLPTVLQRSPIRAVQNLASATADDIASDRDLEYALAKPKWERVPPGRVQGENIWALPRLEPLNQLQATRGSQACLPSKR